MNIQDIKNLDLYKCSLKDINNAYSSLGSYVDRLIRLGHSTQNSFKGSDIYREAKALHVLVARARKGMTPDGYMIGRNIDLDRLPNDKSVLN